MGRPDHVTDTLEAPEPVEPSATSTEPTGRRNSTLVAAGILASRLMGLVRTRVFGHLLGTSAAADAFNVAFRIPNVMQNLLGEGVLSASFIPVYARLVNDGRDEDAGRVAGAVLGLLAAIAGVVTLLVVVLAGPITNVIAHGFPAPKRDLTVLLMQITTPGIGLLVVSAWCLGVLNSHRRFFLSYVAPVLWNLAQIVILVTAGVVVLADPLDPTRATPDQLRTLVIALAIGTLVGGLAQLLVQVPSVLRLVPHLRPSLNRTLPGVRRVLRQAGPVVLGRGVVQIATFVDVLLASFLATGAVSLLYYSQQLYLLPVSLFGMSVAAAELPDLSTMAPGDETALRTRIDDGLERVGFWVAGSALLYLVVGDKVVGLLWGSGAFDRQVQLTVWAVLGVFSLGLIATTSSRLVQSLLYGIGDTTTPARVAVMRVLVSMAIGGIAMLQLDRFGLVDGGITLLDPGSLPAWTPVSAALRDTGTLDQLRLGAVGLALGATAGAWLEWRRLATAAATHLGTRPVLAGRRRGRLVMPLLAALGAGIVMRVLVDGWPLLPAAIVAIGVTGATYVVAAFRTRVREIHGVVASIAPRLGRLGRVLQLWQASLRRRND